MAKKTPKSHWNYRVLKRTHQNGPGTFVDHASETVTFGIHEVYYTKGKPHSISVNPIAPCSESKKELRKELKKFKKALKMPVLNFEDF